MESTTGSQLIHEDADHLDHLLVTSLLVAHDAVAATEQGKGGNHNYGLH